VDGFAVHAFKRRVNILASPLAISIGRRRVSPRGRRYRRGRSTAACAAVHPSM